MTWLFNGAALYFHFILLHCLSFVEVEVASQTFEKKEIVLGVSDGIFVEVKEGLQITDKLKVWNALKAVSASE